MTHDCTILANGLNKVWEILITTGLLLRFWEKRKVNKEVGEEKLRDVEMGRGERKCEGGEKSVCRQGMGNFAELRYYCVSGRGSAGGLTTRPLGRVSQGNRRLIG